MGEFVGYAGAALISMTLLPQIVHTCRLRKVEQLSVAFLCLNVAGTGCLLAYGVQGGLWPVIVCNAIVLVQVTVLIGLYLSFADWFCGCARSDAA